MSNKKHCPPPSAQPHPPRSAIGTPIALATVSRKFLSRRVARNNVERNDQIRWNSSLSTARPGLAYIREWIKLAARTTFNLRATRNWLDYWNSSPFLSQLARTHPQLLKKIYRPYLFCQFDFRQRIAALTSHYDFIAQRQLGGLISRAARAPLVLTQIAGKSGALYRLELLSITCMEREGELVLQLCDDAAVIFSVAFIFLGTGQGHQLAIGCLQGGRAPDARERIRIATREFCGLRPQTLLMRVLQQVGTAFDCDGLTLVGNDNRVMLQQIRKGRVMADYDSSWLELGAARQHDGNFTLPCATPAAPDLTKIASSKRSEAKKRHQLLVKVANYVCSALADFPASEQSLQCASLTGEQGTAVAAEQERLHHEPVPRQRGAAI